MAADQYYVSLADSFGGHVLEDLAIEITTDDHSKAADSNATTTSTAVSGQKSRPRITPLQFHLDLPSPRKKQKMIGGNVQNNQMMQQQEVDTTYNSTSTGRPAAYNFNEIKKGGGGGGKWHKLRSSVQRKMVEMQEERKQILSIGSRRLGSNMSSNFAAGANGSDISSSNAAIAFHLQAQEEEQFQQVLLVKSNSTCSSSSSTDGGGSTDECRQSDDNNHQRRSHDYDNGERCIDDIFEELSPVEEGEEGEDGLVFSSSDEEPLQGHNYPRGSRLRSQLEDAWFALDIANKEKKVLQGQVDAISFKLEKLHKVIQQRSMENSKLNSILDSKNAVLEKQNKQLGILDQALKQSQERNEKLERENQQLRQQLSTPSRRGSSTSQSNTTPESLCSAASVSVMERVSAFASSPMKLGAGSNTGDNTSKSSVAIPFKEKTRFFGIQSPSLEAKQKSKAYMKLSSPDQETKKVFSPNTNSSCTNAQMNITAGAAGEASPSDQSFISVMAKKFSNLQMMAGEKDGGSMARNELEAIRQNHLRGKVQGSKSSLEFAFTQPPKTPKTPNTPAAKTCDSKDLAGTSFSPLRARIDLLGLESPCTGRVVVY